MKWLLSENGRQYDPIFLLEAEEWITLHYNTYHSLWVRLVVALSVWGPWATSRMAQLRPLPSRQPPPPSLRAGAQSPLHTLTPKAHQAPRDSKEVRWAYAAGWKVSALKGWLISNYLENSAMCSSRHCDHQTQGYSAWAEYQKHQGNCETPSHSVFKVSSWF